MEKLIKKCIYERGQIIMFTDAAGREFEYVKGRHAIVCEDSDKMFGGGTEVVILENSGIALCISVEDYISGKNDATDYHFKMAKCHYMLISELIIKQTFVALDVTTGNVFEIPVDSEPVNSEPQAQEPWQAPWTIMDPHTGMRTCRGIFWDATMKERMTFEKGYFHQWGNCYEEFENGPGNYSVAIIELEDGRVIEANPSDIHFTDVIAYEGGDSNDNNN